MEKEPEKQHDLILSIRLNRAPLDLESSLATNDERNECTQAFCDWEDLIEKQNSGDDSVSDNDIVAAYDHAMWLDSFVLEKDTIAREAYQQDYSALSRESCQPVYDSLKAMFGENVTWPTENLNMFAIKANRDEFERLIQVEGVKRVSRNIRISPMLDQSRLSIRADMVNNGVGGVGPYTGQDVKVAIIDDGYKLSHPRLPDVDTNNRFDSIDSYGVGMCSKGHGTQVAGVVFCEPDSNESPQKIGIAYGATPLIAKIETLGGQEIGCATDIDETWDADIDAFDWATVTNPADVINFSRGAVVYGTPDEDHDTLAAAEWSMNVDWFVQSGGACFTHSCGNIPTGAAELAPPSGSYNCISVGAYDDVDTADWSDDVVWTGTSPGPSDDGRKKPDLCAPGVDIVSTNFYGVPPGSASDSGTSYAAPHVAGVCALLLEARPSLIPRQTKAILINSTRMINGLGGKTWHSQAGWGALDAYTAVATRNYIKDGDIPRNVTQSYLFNSAAGQDVSVTLVWQRKMAGIDEGITGSPRNLNLYLDRNVNGNWVQVEASESGALFDGTVFDNAERVFIAGVSAPAAAYRVRVVRPDDGFPQYDESYSLSCRRPLLTNP